MLIEIILKILRIPFVQIYLRCVYTTMKNIFQNHDSLKSKLQFTHNCFAFLGATRFLVYSLYPNETSFFAKHDPMVVFVFKYSNLTTFLIATALFFGFFVLIIFHSYYSMPIQEPIWQWYYNLLVGIQDLKEQFTITNASLREKIVKTKYGECNLPWDKTVVLLKIWRNQDFVDKRKLYRKSTILASASEKLRMRLLLGLPLADNMCFQSHMLIGLLFVVTVLKFFLTFIFINFSNILHNPFCVLS